MKSIMLAACAAVLGASVAGAAMAEPVLAKLQNPLQSPSKPVAGGAVFECLGDVCAARAPTPEAAGLRGCRDLARQVGSLATFGVAAKPLPGDQLTECNQAARK